MSWQGILNHDPIVERFRRMLSSDRLASTFLFVGPSGIGKRTFALTLAKSLLCQRHEQVELSPCGVCPGCIQVAAATHPDLLLIRRPRDRAEIPVRLLIGEQEKRGQEGFLYDLSLKPFYGRNKIGIIDDADDLNDEGANALLKTLEEPPPKSVLILIGTSALRQLPTIRSRCQIVRFQPLSLVAVAEILLTKKLAANEDEARRWATYSQGSVSQALALADEKIWGFRREFVEQLAVARIDAIRLSKLVSDFVKEANKDAAELRARLGAGASALEEAATDAGERRARLRLIIEFSLEYYRRLMLANIGASRSDDPEMQGWVERGARQFPGDPEEISACLLRCFDALSDVDRNANQQTLIECWLDELALLQARQPLPEPI